MNKSLRNVQTSLLCIVQVSYSFDVEFKNRHSWILDVHLHFYPVQTRTSWLDHRLQKVVFSRNSNQSQTSFRGPALSTQGSVQFSVSRQEADNSLSDTDVPSFALSHKMFHSRTGERKTGNHIFRVPTHSHQSSQKWQLGLELQNVTAAPSGTSQRRHSF